MYRVLIADQDQEAAALLLQALSTDDRQIEVVPHGEDVLRRLRAGQVDILITEVNLPDMPAWELISQIHRLALDVPIIAVTKDDSWETSRSIRIEHGPVFFYGLKPLNLREIQEVVRAAVRWIQRHRTGVEQVTWNGG